MNLNIFQNANHHSHSKNSHGLWTQQKVFRYIYIVLCLVSLSVRLLYIHWGLTQLKSSCGPRAMLSRFTSKRARHYALNWFNCLVVCPFRAKSGKYYSRKRGKLMQLGKEMTIIALGFYLIREKLQLLQTFNSEYTMKYVQSALTYLQQKGWKMRPRAGKDLKK